MKYLMFVNIVFIIVSIVLAIIANNSVAIGANISALEGWCLVYMFYDKRR